MRRVADPVRGVRDQKPRSNKYNTPKPIHTGPTSYRQAAYTLTKKDKHHTLYIEIVLFFRQTVADGLPACLHQRTKKLRVHCARFVRISGQPHDAIYPYSLRIGLDFT